MDVNAEGIQDKRPATSKSYTGFQLLTHSIPTETEKTVNLVKMLVLVHECYIPIKGSLIASLICQVLYSHFPSVPHIPVFLAEICLDNFAFRIRSFSVVHLLNFKTRLCLRTLQKTPPGHILFSKSHHFLTMHQ